MIYPPEIYLFRIGIDKGLGGGLAPLYADGSFEFIPIPSNNSTIEARTYMNTLTKKGEAFALLLLIPCCLDSSLLFIS